MWSVTDGTEDEIPSHVTVNLLRDGVFLKSADIEPDATGRWLYTFEELDISASDGHKYEYTVEEEAIAHFHPIYAGDMETGFVIINNYTLTNLNLSGIKVWDGDDPASRPDSITVRLLANEQEIEHRKVTPNAFGAWYFEFGDHPMFNKETGEEIIYTIEEDPVPGYIAEYGYTNDGDFKIRNRATNSIPVRKEWADNDNENGSRPRDVVVNLLATRFTNADALSWNDGKTIDMSGNESIDENTVGYVFHLASSSDFVGEIKCDGRVKDAIVQISSQEGKVISSSTVNVNGLTEPVAFELGEISENAVIRIVDSGGNDIHDNILSFLVHDSSTATHVISSMTLSNKNNWQGSFDELSERDNKGFMLSYSVQEAPCYGYLSEVNGNETNGYVITNHEIEEIDVNKIWAGSDNPEYASRVPEKIELELIANGEPTGKTISLTADSNWSGVFTDISWRDESGKEISYTIGEKPVNGWTCSKVNNNIESTGDITIINVPSFRARFTKAWVGDAAHIDERPDSVTVSLRRYVEGIASMSGDFEQWGAEASSTLNRFTDSYGMPSQAEYSFTNSSDSQAFVKFSFEQSGKESSSHVVSLPAKQSITGVLDISTLDEDTEVSIIVSDVNTAGQESAALARNGYISGKLYLDAIEEVEQLEIKAENEWTAQGKEYELIDENGNEISYEAMEVTQLPSYSSSIAGSANDGYTITNTFGKIDIPVTKIWNDLDDKDLLRPSEIKIALLGNGVETGNVLALSADNDWHGFFKLLDTVDNNGEIINYSVREVTEINGYTTRVIGDAKDGYTVINSHDPKTNVTITKVWDDTNNVKRIRPSKLTVHLMRGHTEIEQAEMSGDSDTWSYTFHDLPYLDNDGIPIEYTVIEDAVNDYTQTSMQKTDSGYVIVNWTAAPLVELPFSGGAGFWFMVFTGLGFASISFGLSMLGQEKLMAKIRATSNISKEKQ